jgi:hypothetical protein
LNSKNILEELDTLVRESAHKRQSFLVAVTRSSKSISEGASAWFYSEIELLKREMAILKNVMPEDVSEWSQRIQTISNRFDKALSYLNKIIAQAEKGEIKSIGEVHPPKPEIEEIKPFSLTPIELSKEKEEEKELSLVSAILEVFDSATDLEKLIKEIEKESKRTVSTFRLILNVMRSSKKK